MRAVEGGAGEAWEDEGDYSIKNPCHVGEGLWATKVNYDLMLSDSR